MNPEPVKLDWDGFLRNLRRQGTPERVYYFEHGVSGAMQQALAQRFGLWNHLDPASPTHKLDRVVPIHRFLGQELFRVFPSGARIAAPKKEGAWAEESAGVITSWQEFEQFDWPRPEDADLSVLEYYEKNLPGDMRVFHVVDVWEVVRDGMGFETVCYKFYEEPELIDAIFEKVGGFVEKITAVCCDFDCYAGIYLGDDLGYKTSLMISPDTIRRHIMPWHKRIADAAHARGKLFLFHSCGQMYDLIDDYIDEVRIDAKHSFEEAVLPVTEVKKRWGDRLSLLGGVDVDFLARGSEEQVRRKTREILDVCQPGGGYFLGSGNWVTNYIPPDNYLAMLDEARRY